MTSHSMHVMKPQELVVSYLYLGGPWELEQSELVERSLAKGTWPFRKRLSAPFATSLQILDPPDTPQISP